MCNNNPFLKKFLCHFFKIRVRDDTRVEHLFVSDASPKTA